MNNTYTLITGASSGIGKACAELFAEQGRNLILAARRLERLEEIKESLSKNEIDILIYQVDVSKVDEVNKLFQEIEGRQLDLVINNAGLAREALPLDEFSWQDIDDMLQVNIKGFIQVAQLSIPKLKETKGHMICMGSIAGKEAYEGGTVYCASKAFVQKATEGFRIDVAGSGVRITNIAPGAVETEFSNVRFHGNEDKASAVYSGYTPLNAQDIAGCIEFAVSRPAHVNIDYMLVMPTAQASAKRIAR